MDYAKNKKEESKKLGAVAGNCCPVFRTAVSSHLRHTDYAPSCIGTALFINQYPQAGRIDRLWHHRCQGLQNM